MLSYVVSSINDVIIIRIHDFASMLWRMLVQIIATLDTSIRSIEICVASNVQFKVLFTIGSTILPEDLT